MAKMQVSDLLSCATCHYFVPAKDGRGGWCHGGPPQLVMVPKMMSNLATPNAPGGVMLPFPESRWPNASPDGFCGAHPMSGAVVAHAAAEWNATQAAAAPEPEKNGDGN